MSVIHIDFGQHPAKDMPSEQDEVWRQLCEVVRREGCRRFEFDKTFWNEPVLKAAFRHEIRKRVWEVDARRWWWQWLRRRTRRITYSGEEKFLPVRFFKLKDDAWREVTGNGLLERTGILTQEYVYDAVWSFDYTSHGQSFAIWFCPANEEVAHFIVKERERVTLSKIVASVYGDQGNDWAVETRHPGSVYTALTKKEELNWTRLNGCRYSLAELRDADETELFINGLRSFDTWQRIKEWGVEDGRFGRAMKFALDKAETAMKKNNPSECVESKEIELYGYDGVVRETLIREPDLSYTVLRDENTGSVVVESE